MPGEITRPRAGEGQADEPWLGERFEVEQLLGQGAFGTVFQAWDRVAEERVAVKRLDRLDAQSRVRFKREFRALARVHHPGLVGLYELHAMRSTYGFSMELVQGRPFVEAFRESGDRAALLARLVEALTALHEEGWLHNDLKPANALVTSAGRVALLDFGLVAPRDAAGRRAGTLAYMAPEPDAGVASDWYAVGTMIFEALAGELPFTGRGRHLLMRKRQTDAPSLREPSRGVDPAWAALCEQLLKRTPEERLEGLHARIETVTGARLERRGSGPRFVGRDTELAELRRALEEPSEHSMVVEIRGPSGIGKSTLLARATRELDTPVLRATCSPQETLATAGLDALVDVLAEQLETTPETILADDAEGWSALATMFPQLGEAPSRVVEPASARVAATRALATLLAATASRPVLVIDDAQWLDDDSGELLSALLARTPMTVITSMRTDLGVVRRALNPDVEIELTPLGAEHARHLVGAELYERLDPEAWQSAEGRPFFLLELAQMTRGGDRPLSMSALLTHRLDALSEDERELLSILALAQRPIERRIAASALNDRREGGSFLDAVTSLRARRLIEMEGVRAQHHVQLQHDLVRRAATDRLDSEEVVAIHGALDDTIERLEIHDPEAQGTHALAAGRLDRGRGLLRVAAHEAETRFAFRRAANLYRTMREAGPMMSGRRLDLHRLEGEAWGKAGQGVKAAGALDAAIGLLGQQSSRSAERDALTLACQRAEHLMRCGATEEAVRGQREVLARVGLRWRGTPALALASIVGNRLLERVASRAPRAKLALDPLVTDVCFAAGLSLTNVDPIRGTDFVMRSLLRARLAGDLLQTARAAAFVACYACNGGHRMRGAAARMIDEADELAAHAGDDYARATVVAARCLFAFHNGEYRRAITGAQATATAYAAVPGAVRERATGELYEVLARGLVGDYEGATELTRRRIREAIERGDRWAETSLRTSLPNLVWLVQDRPARALEEADAAIQGWDRSAYHLQHLFDAFARARIALYEDRVSDALEQLDTVMAPARRALHLRSPFIWITLLELRARTICTLVIRGERTRGELSQARRDAKRIGREGSAWSRGFAMSVRASIERAERRDPASTQRQAERRFIEAGLVGHARSARFAWTRDPGPLNEIGVIAPSRFAPLLSGP